ncbi:hypothetical protein CI610_03120 [invertebrate metagenome]|uniref:Uncharacterized protein n=1 Tax=invertebrate metagenome TaxID=1711999 RepID=A0A2H9T415_9ZZZZ
MTYTAEKEKEYENFLRERSRKVKVVRKEVSIEKENNKEGIDNTKRKGHGTTHTL